MAAKTITDVTTGALDGTGAFDKIMAAVTVQLDAQFAASRLTGADYASVYLGALQSAMSQAVQFTLGVGAANGTEALLGEQLTTQVQTTAKTTSEKSLLDQKKVTEEAQTVGTVTDGTSSVGGEAGKKMELYDAQKNGFARDAEQKLTKILLEPWSIAKSMDTTGLVNLPANCNQNTLTAVIEQARIGIDAPSGTAPATPTGLAATTPTSLAATLNWNTVSGATYYEVYWNTTGNVGTNDDKLYPGDATSIVHTGLDAVEYFYRVRAVSDDGTSQLSIEDSILVTA